MVGAQHDAIVEPGVRDAVQRHLWANRGGCDPRFRPLSTSGALIARFASCGRAIERLN